MNLLNNIFSSDAVIPIFWVNWIIRGCLFLLLASLLGVFFRWIKGDRTDWRDFWKALNVSLKRQFVSLALLSIVCVVIAILIPRAQLDPRESQALSGLMGSFWIVLTAWVLTLVSSVFVNMLRWKYNMEVADNLLARRMHTRIRVLQRIIVIIVWIGALAGMLLQFERFQALGTTLLASAGIMSILLGISAQKTFGTMVAGIQLAISNPINLDDVVIVEGEWGKIEEVTFTYVVVNIWDQRRLIVPLTYFLEHPFQNWTRKSANITGSVTLHVDYSTPLEPLREEARRICEAAGFLWDGKFCILHVTEAGPENMTIRVIAGSPDASKAWDLRCLLREGLITFLQREYPDCLPRQRLMLLNKPDES